MRCFHFHFHPTAVVLLEGLSSFVNQLIITLHNFTRGTFSSPSYMAHSLLTITHGTLTITYGTLHYHSWHTHHYTWHTHHHIWHTHSYTHIAHSLLTITHGTFTPHHHTWHTHSSPSLMAHSLPSITQDTHSIHSLRHMVDTHTVKTTRKSS